MTMRRDIPSDNRADPGLRAGRLITYATAAMLAAFTLWASWAEIDQVTRVPGKAIPSSRNQVIQVPDAGLVESILVKEGDSVKKGQALMRFDQVKAQAAYLEHRAKEVALMAAVARLQAEMTGAKPEFPKEAKEYPEIESNQVALYNARQAGLREDIRLLEQNLALVEDELNLSRPLLASGDVSKVDILRLGRQAVEIKGKIALRRNKFREDAQGELARAQEQLESETQTVAQLHKSLENTEILAPADGIVRNVKITTLGGFARAGDELMQIVPVDDELLFECKVKPRDIAFIRIGHPATIKLDAYDYSIYGTLTGEVSFISADTMTEDIRSASDEPYYRVHVKTDGRIHNAKANKSVTIQPGMTATVEIITGKNTVLKFITKPLTKTIANSLGER
jgi:adhesin transport system membrane fusion protein